MLIGPFGSPSRAMLVSFKTMHLNLTSFSGSDAGLEVAKGTSFTSRVVQKCDASRVVSNKLGMFWHHFFGHHEMWLMSVYRNGETWTPAVESRLDADSPFFPPSLIPTIILPPFAVNLNHSFSSCRWSLILGRYILDSQGLDN